VFDDLSSLDRVRVFEKGVAASDSEVDSFGEFRLLMRDGDIISPRVEATEPLKEQCRHFLDCIERGTAPLTDGETGVDVVRVMEAATASIRAGGTPVEIRSR
jgi:predicted dehydrogenase